MTMSGRYRNAFFMHEKEQASRCGNPKGFASRQLDG
jgi:hypothetical protein